MVGSYFILISIHDDYKYRTYGLAEAAAPRRAWQRRRRRLPRRLARPHPGTATGSDLPCVPGVAVPVLGAGHELLGVRVVQGRRTLEVGLDVSLGGGGGGQAPDALPCMEVDVERLCEGREGWQGGIAQDPAGWAGVCACTEGIWDRKCTMLTVRMPPSRRFELRLCVPRGCAERDRDCVPAWENCSPAAT